MSADPDDPVRSGDGWKQAEAALARALGPSSTAKGKPGKRERVVLAERRSSRRVVRTRVDVEEQTEVGVVWARELLKAQLKAAVRLMALTVLVLGAVPLLFLLAPSLGTVGIVGIPLHWVLLGVAVYPFFVAVAWSYNRAADRNEQEFTEMVEN